MRAMVLALALVLAGPASGRGGHIDLDLPGALERLAHDNPVHYAKVQHILAEAPHLPLSSIERVIRTRYDAQDVTAPYLLKTSFPAQTRLSFRLGGVEYTKVIYVELTPVVTPAR